MPKRVSEPSFDELKAMAGQQLTDGLRPEHAALNERIVSHQGVPEFAWRDLRRVPEEKLRQTIGHSADVTAKNDAPHSQRYLQGFLSGVIIGGIFGAASLCLYYRMLHGISNEWEPTIVLIAFICISLFVIIKQLRSKSRHARAPAS
jgi:hypothetical protein